MIPEPVRLHNPTGPDRVAVVSAAEAWGTPGSFHVLVARGPRAGKLGMGTTYGPFTVEELADRFAEVVAALGLELFAEAGRSLLIDALLDARPQVRARAAARLGWRRDRGAVGPLIAALASAEGETCALLDALGAIGDPVAIPAVRPFAGRKLLSRRRSAVEALRLLGDLEGLAEHADRIRATLPEPLLTALDAIDPDDPRPGAEDAIVSVFPSVEDQYRGLALDTLYELGTPVAVAAIRAVLPGLRFDRVYHWRYLKSIYKRSMLRHDAVTFGLLSHAIEARGRQTKGVAASVKSGLDGGVHHTRIFARPTQRYLRRLAWRYLRNLARHRPDRYAAAAAEALVPYGPEDAREPSGLYGAFADCYLLNRILHNQGDRLVLDHSRLSFRWRDADSFRAPADRREEAFPDRWDAHPRAYLRLLGSSRLPSVHAFALRAVEERHRDILGDASVEELLPMLRAPHEPTVRLGLDELRRRFDPEHPDLLLVDRLIADQIPEARELARSWLRESSPLWTRDAEWVVLFTTSGDPDLSMLAAGLAADRLKSDPGLRRILSARLLDLFRQPEAQPGSLDAYLLIARDALLDDLDEQLDLDTLIHLILTGPPQAQALGGDLLARRPEAVEKLGLEGLSQLANHEIAAVRAATHALLRLAVDRFRDDPGPLLMLVESDWPDTRVVAFGLLRDGLGPDVLGPPGLMGLLDSNRVDVQDVARVLVLRHVDRFDPVELVPRLVEHPHPNMRRFALDLVIDHLPDGAEALDRLSWFFRAALFDLRPERPVKRRIINFLRDRGLRDPFQARVAAELLGDFARSATRSDADRALHAVVSILIAHPDTPSDVSIGHSAGGVA
ncbi:HEAT repeat domain-containing protein [Tautonia plasticadhaerens]|uniref:HEAT repeat protein n=1 Tax=Tautonia plasticadhaerens TaxID=2527974 RepID=A0A518HC70_9BACT|nr:HEAT repeat domain-containing protein [Tautonia plasticadhaerens]QDV38455.1 hypothetical protein ElP_64100 [Tautonia plasticadhaerens]